MTDREKAIKELKEALDNLDIINKYRLNLIKAIEYLQEEPMSEDLEEAAKDYGIRQGAELKPFAIKFFKAGAKWGKNQAKVEIQAQSMAIVHGCPEEHVSEDLDEATNNYVLNARKGYPRVMDETDRYICNAFKDGAKWQAEQDKQDHKT